MQLHTSPGLDTSVINRQIIQSFSNRLRKYVCTKFSQKICAASGTVRATSQHWIFTKGYNETTWTSSLQPTMKRPSNWKERMKPKRINSSNVWITALSKTSVETPTLKVSKVETKKSFTKQILNFTYQIKIVQIIIIFCTALSPYQFDLKYFNDPFRCWF